MLYTSRLLFLQRFINRCFRSSLEFPRSRCWYVSVHNGTSLLANQSSFTCHTPSLTSFSSLSSFPSTRILYGVVCTYTTIVYTYLGTFNDYQPLRQHYYTKPFIPKSSALVPCTKPHIPQPLALVPRTKDLFSSHTYSDLGISKLLPYRIHCAVLCN